MKAHLNDPYDYIIIGSGFGGSVSALRLSEKGYKVLVIEKGKWYNEKDFPETNWNIRKWLWLPVLKCFGILKLTIFKHVSILSGVGVGGGSLVYANTLPVPKSEFFTTGSWAKLGDWQKELKPFYDIALRMLGAQKNPTFFDGDLALKELAEEMGITENFESPEVAVYFGKPNQTVSDPYFHGKGPQRTGCTYCGGCMTGCKVGAKNTLDKNYLFLAQKLGATILAERKVIDVKPSGNVNGLKGYEVYIKDSMRRSKKSSVVKARGIVFSGGVLGTVPLLLKLKQGSLTGLSDMVGSDLRINNETLVTVASMNQNLDFSKGVSIGSILQTDTNSHLEIVRYGKGSGFWKLSHVPHVTGNNVFVRFLSMVGAYIASPLQYFRTYWKGDWAKKSAILLFMQSVDTTLKLKRNRNGKINTSLGTGPKPLADIPESTLLTKKYAKLINGKPMAFFQQPIMNKASTAHILGGAVMADSSQTGVIDKENRVFGYENMFVVDGSMISANPGVNPSLTITALAERAMSKVSKKQ